MADKLGTLQERWQACVDRLRKLDYRATLTAVLEDGPQEGIDYESLGRESVQPSPRKRRHEPHCSFSGENAPCKCGYDGPAAQPKAGEASAVDNKASQLAGEAMVICGILSRPDSPFAPVIREKFAALLRPHLGERRTAVGEKCPTCKQRVLPTMGLGDCATPDCQNKACLSRNSPYCYPCTRLRDGLTWPQVQAEIEANRHRL